MPNPPTPRERPSRTVLPNGIVVLSQRVAALRTVAFAVGSRHGSRDETQAEAGLSHFLEHFLFRGTLPRRVGERGRSAEDVAAATDLLGGELDATTHRESTCYLAECSAGGLVEAARLVADLVARPELPAAAFEAERSVVREEIRGYQDSAEERVHELSLMLSWPGHAVGRPVEGTAASLRGFSIEGVRRFWAQRHAGSNLVVCAAGRLEHATVARLAREGLGQLPAPRSRNGPAAPAPRGGRVVERWPGLEQAHFVLAWPGVRAGHVEAPAHHVLAAILGGGASSRLVQRVRERDGLAYDVSASHHPLRDRGRLVLQATVDPSGLRRALAAMTEELADLAACGPRADELERAVAYASGGLLLDHEGPAARALDLLADELVFGRPVGVPAHVRSLTRVRPADVRAAARRALRGGGPALAVVGPTGLRVPPLPELAPARPSSRRGSRIV